MPFGFADDDVGLHAAVKIALDRLDMIARLHAPTLSATLLANFCGTDHFTFHSTSASATRVYSSFWQAAEEAGRSRIYGGIHWDFDKLPPSG